MDGEATVVIDGQFLSPGQVMSLRVAVGHYLSELRDPEFARLLGPIAHGYRNRLSEINWLLVDNKNRDKHPPPEPEPLPESKR